MTESSDSDRHELVFDLFRRAMDMDGEERLAFLERECSDPSVRAEVRGLLELDGEARPEGETEKLELRIEGAAPLSAPRVPATIGPYRLGRLLGSGAMGSVFVAEQERPRRDVALKVLNPGVHPEVLRRFEFEAEVLARLDHAGIAQVIEAGTFEDPSGARPFFALELVDGQTLDAYAAERTLDLHQTLNLVAEIAEAVHHAHLRGIVHRDLKPANILVTAQGHPKVLDFGVARVTGADRADTLATSAGQLIGTMAYMSPEQAAARPDDIDPRSDVYALGVILYELLAGCLPHDLSGLQVLQAVRIVVERDPVPLGQQRKDLAGDVQTIVAKALERERERRYSSAEALALDLRRYLAHEPIAARPATTLYQLSRFARRNRPLVAGVAVALLALVAALITSLVSLSRVRRARIAEQAEFQRAEAEAETARAVERFLTRDMIGAASPFRGGRDVRVVDVLDAAVPRIATAFADQDRVRASVQLSLGASYFELGLWSEARELLEKAVDDSRDLFGDLDPRTLEARYELGRVVSYEEPAEAAALFQVLLKDWRSTGGEEHVETLRVLGDLGSCLASSGDLEAGLPLVRETYEVSRRVFGDVHGRTLAAQRKLAECLDLAGLWEEAESLLRAYLKDSKEVLGEGHADRISATRALSWVVMSLGRTQEAEEIVRTAIADAQRVYGEEAAYTLVNRAALAGVLSARRKYVEAEAESRAVVEAAEETLGANHAFTLQGRHHLATALRDLERFEEAEAQARIVVTARRETLGERAPLVADSLNVLAGILMQQDQYEQAAEYLEQALDVAREAYGPKNPATADILSTYGGLMMRLGKYAQAEETFHSLSEVDRALRGDDHVYVALDLQQLGRARARQQRHDEARRAFEQSVEIHLSANPEGSTDLYHTLVDLGQSLVELEDFPGAEARFLGALQGFESLGSAEAQERIRRTELRERLDRLYASWRKDNPNSEAPVTSTDPDPDTPEHP